ncbi:unnamed protein product, partial [Thlaspi arvense]
VKSPRALSFVDVGFPQIVTTMKSLANAVGAKTARACDSCVKRRARWYCAADDAFLCQPCDGLVHSANPLARRHERVRLKTASPAVSKHSNHSHSASSSPPQEAATWHHGFTRKPRTPRGSGKKSNPSIFHDLVPEISVEDQTDSYEQEEQLICQVPVLDPFVAEQFLNDVVEPKIEFPMMRTGVMMIGDKEDEDNAESCLNGFFPTDMELEEFAADVETLLGRGLENEPYAMEELGLSNSEMFKIEKDDEIEETKAINMGILGDDDDRDERDGMVPFELSFDYESHKTDEEEVMLKNADKSSGECIKVKKEEQKNAPMLRLNYDSVISTWGGQGLPWTSGEPPELDIDISGWPAVSMVENGGESHQKQYVGGCLPSSGFGDGGREARVSRYREKRRTRLFSKKIRYEVRKLNAEKRPRMKGRFVKRASLAVSATN